MSFSYRRFDRTLVTMVSSASSLLVTLGAVQGARAWGTLGHATIAYIAQNYVTDEVASWCV